MANEKCCRIFHMITGAAITGVLQAIIVITLLSTTAVLLARSRSWRSQYEMYRSQDVDYTTTSTSLNPTGTVLFSPRPTTVRVWNQAAVAAWPEDGEWRRDSGLSAFLEIHLAHHVAFYSLWLLCLALYALAFRSHRAAWVLPNLIMQIIGLLLIMILAGIVIAKLVNLNRQYNSMIEEGHEVPSFSSPFQWERDDINVRYAFVAVLLGILVIAWVAEVIFIWVSIDFYKYLRDNYRTVHPGSAVVTRGSYHQHRDSHDHGPQIHNVAVSVEPPIKGTHRDTSPTRMFTHGDTRVHGDAGPTRVVHSDGMAPTRVYTHNDTMA